MGGSFREHLVSFVDAEEEFKELSCGDRLFVIVFSSSFFIDMMEASFSFSSATLLISSNVCK